VTVAVVAAAPGRSPKALGEILAAAHEARQAGAKVVIVGLRWGTAYRHGANPGQVALAQRLLASPDIDLLVGHGAHVVQPYARALNGKWVAYGLGDLTGREALLGRFTFGLRKDRWTVARAGFTPTVLEHGRVLDVPAELAGPGVSPSRRAALKAVQDRTAKIVYSRHTLPALTG
jgi:poly-gamma-glutamate synthesis protein (capsule biosynthesis protein)